MEFIQELMKRVLAIIVVCGLILLAFLFGKRCSRVNNIINTETRTDTVVTHDTITIIQPEVRYQKVIRNDTIYVNSDTTVFKGDSIAVSVPIEAKIYRDSIYEVQISGYNPSLDWIKVYPETRYINTINYTTKKVQFTILGGAEYDLIGHSIVPNIRMNLNLRKVQFNARMSAGYSIGNADFVRSVAIGVEIPIWSSK